MHTRPYPARSRLAIAYASFFTMGLGGGLLAVAWPSIMAGLDLGLDATGVLFAFDSFGYVLYSLPSGWLVARFGLGPVLLCGAAAKCLGLLGFGLAPSWTALLAAALIGGVGTGAVDAGLNTFFASECRASHTTWLHASCGLGSMAGPAIMVALPTLGLEWSAGYIIAATLQGLIAIGYVATLRGWPLVRPTTVPPLRAPARAASRLRDVARHPAVLLLVMLFFITTGVEVAGGQWPYSLFTAARQIPEAQAGMWASIYFGCIISGRIFAGAIVGRVGVNNTLRMATVGAFAGAVLLSFPAPRYVGFAGLALLGLGVGPVFSLLVAGTLQAVGEERTPHTIGMGMTSAVLGVAALQGVLGMLAQRFGLQIVGPVLAGSAALLLLVHEFAMRMPPPSVRSTRADSRAANRP